MAQHIIPQPRARTPTTRAGRPVRRQLPLASLPLLLFLVVPLLALVLRVAPAALLAHLVDRTVAQAIGLSISTTLTSTLLTLVTGTPVAYLLARRRFRGHGALDTLLDLPMVLPPAVAGIALLIAFGRQGLLGRYLKDAGIEIAFTGVAVVLAQTFVAAPFYVKAAATGFSGIERELELAAAIDGAGPLRIFQAITLPLAWPVLLGGLVMTWARALGEFGATIIFAGNFPGRTQTMPLAIYIGFELDFDVALTLAVLLLASSFAVLFVVKYMLGRPARVA
ncbi:MAG: molybdate ABC transporter permease subunit [Herpetosiphonaceae bacterium]|nr:molybdate ABC transporter permease subunit [Herpetosiphonaceae bacterium]